MARREKILRVTSLSEIGFLNVDCDAESVYRPARPIRRVGRRAINK